MRVRGLARRDLLRAGALAGAGLAVPAALTGCGSGNPAAAAGNVLRVSQSADTITMDPQKQGDMTSMNVLINIFDTLTTRSPQNELAPGLATSWRVVDERTWRFRLRRGVRFHNGEPCDAAAVKFSIERLIDPKTRSPIVELRYVTAARVVDRYTVDVITSEHDPILPAKVSLFGGVVLPPRYLARVGAAEFARRPVGTGPFRFVSWQRDRHVVLAANRGYWRGRPRVDRLVFSPMPNAASSLAALQSGELDIVAGLTPDAALQLQGYAGVRIAKFPGIRTYYVSLDTEYGPLRHRAVRQALNHALDVPLLISAVLSGDARQVPTMIPRESFGYDPDVTPYRHDPALARRLLAQAGFPHGFDIELSASNEDPDVPQAIGGLLDKVGVRTKVNLMDPGTFSARLVSNNRHALGPMYYTGSTGWTMDGESHIQSNVRHDRRQSRWHDRTADRLVDSEEQSVRPATRRRALGDLQRLLKTEAPFLFLYQTDNVFAMNERVSWRPNAVGSLTMRNAVIS